jgi:hypothetical protein
MALGGLNAAGERLPKSRQQIPLPEIFCADWPDVIVATAHAPSSQPNHSKVQLQTGDNCYDLAHPMPNTNGETPVPL